jgi:hypothetical protein
MPVIGIYIGAIVFGLLVMTIVSLYKYTLKKMKGQQ